MPSNDNRFNMAGTPLLASRRNGQVYSWNPQDLPPSHASGGGFAMIQPKLSQYLPIGVKG
jgi:hypothetical protein